MCQFRFSFPVYRQCRCLRSVKPRASFPSFPHAGQTEVASLERPSSAFLEEALSNVFASNQGRPAGAKTFFRFRLAGLGAEASQQARPRFQRTCRWDGGGSIILVGLQKK